MTFHLSCLGRVAPVVHETILTRPQVRKLASATVRNDDQVCAVVMARRQSGSGKVIWVTLLNAASHTGDQATRAKATTAIAELRAQTGIPAE
jgi:hypothetical protein